MVPNLLEFSTRVKSMVTGRSNGSRVFRIRVSGPITAWMEKAHTNGRTDASTQANGRKTICTGMGFTAGPMAVTMRVITLMTSVRAKERLCGLMAVRTLVSGKMAKCTEEVNTLNLTVK